MTAPTTTLSDQDLAALARFHGHLCPMVLLGARLAKAARRELEGAAPEGGEFRPFAFLRGYGCAVDGVQVLAGCTWGNGNLALLRGGDFALLLTVEGGRQGILARPRDGLVAELRGNDRGGVLATAMGRSLVEGPVQEVLRLDRGVCLGDLTAYPGR